MPSLIKSKYIRARVDDKEADFWIRRVGSITTVGTPSKEYGPNHIGIKVLDRERILPGYLYYVFEYLYMHHVWERVAHGSTGLQTITIYNVYEVFRNCVKIPEETK